MPALVFEKYLNEKFGITVDWTEDADQLGATITTSTFTTPAGAAFSGITKVSDAILSGSKKTQAIFSSGAEGVEYAGVNKVVFNDPAGTTLEQAFFVPVFNAAPLSTGGLTTTSRVLRELGLTDRTQQGMVDDLIMEATDAIEQYCGRKFATAAMAEALAGNGRKIISISRPPITTLTSIILDGVAVDSALYEIHDANAGLLYMEDGWKDTRSIVPFAAGETAEPGSGRKLYTVNYTGGYILPGVAGRTLPRDLERACIEMVKYYRNAPKNPNIKRQEVPGVYSVEYGQLEQEESVPPFIARIIDPYRVLL